MEYPMQASVLSQVVIIFVKACSNSCPLEYLYFYFIKWFIVFMHESGVYLISSVAFFFLIQLHWKQI